LAEVALQEATLSLERADIAGAAGADAWSSFLGEDASSPSAGAAVGNAFTAGTDCGSGAADKVGFAAEGTGMAGGACGADGVPAGGAGDAADISPLHGAAAAGTPGSEGPTGASAAAFAFVGVDACAVVTLKRPSTLGVTVPVLDPAGAAPPAACEGGAECD